MVARYKRFQTLAVNVLTWLASVSYSNLISAAICRLNVIHHPFDRISFFFHLTCSFNFGCLQITSTESGRLLNATNARAFTKVLSLLLLTTMPSYRENGGKQSKTIGQQLLIKIARPLASIEKYWNALPLTNWNLNIKVTQTRRWWAKICIRHNLSVDIIINNLNDLIIVLERCDQLHFGFALLY